MSAQKTPTYGAEPGSLQHLVAIIDHHADSFAKLAGSYGVSVPGAHDLEARTALAVKLGQDHPDFETRFTKEVEGAKSYDERGFDFMAIFKKVGQAFKTIFTAIKTAVDKHKAAKAAATAKADAAKKDAGPKPEVKKGHGPVIAVIVVVVIVVGALWYAYSGGEKKA